MHSNEEWTPLLSKCDEKSILKKKNQASTTVLLIVVLIMILSGVTIGYVSIATTEKVDYS